MRLWVCVGAVGSSPFLSADRQRCSGFLTASVDVPNCVSTLMPEARNFACETW